MIIKQDLIKTKGIVMVDFYADWCAPCKVIAPILDTISKEQQVELIKVNVDENHLLASEYGIRGIPTVLFFKDGELKETIVGIVPKSKIESILLTIK